MTRARRVLIYAQHLTGVGHYVRARELALGLATRHTVALVEGGRAVPRPRSGPAFQRIALPALRRGAAGLDPVAADRPLAEVLGERGALLARAVREFAPEVVVVEHYPFSKWELATEIHGAVAEARRVDPDAALVCSIRDVSPRTRHEADAGYADRVCETLNAGFDALWVHADPRFARLDEHFDAADRIAIPVAHTGFVSEKLPPDAVRPAEAPADAPLVIASAGGGASSTAWLAHLIDAWAKLESAPDLSRHELVVFCGGLLATQAVADLQTRARGARCRVLPFSDAFLAWMYASAVSISRAGYNTCTNLLETRTRAVLVPDPRMSDQGFRARRLSDFGLAEVLDEAEATADALGRALRRACARPPPEHDFSLDGAARACALVDALGPAA